MARVTFHVLINEEADGSLWAEVEELPGCFASGFSMPELQEALYEALQLWLPDGVQLGRPKWTAVPSEDEPRTGKRKAARKAAPKQKKLLVCA